MKKTIFLTVFIAVAIVAISCSGTSSENAKSSAKTDKKPKTVEQVAKLDPTAFAKEFNDIWADGVKQMDALLDKYPKLNADFEKESFAVIDATIKRVLPYGEFLDGKSQAEKTKYLLKLPSSPSDKNGDVMMPFQIKLNNRFKEFNDFPGLYVNVTELNVLGSYLKFDNLRENHPSTAEKYGIK